MSQSLFWWNVVVYWNRLNPSLFGSWCRNPCFGGMLLSTELAKLKEKEECRNPCFGGMLLSTDYGGLRSGKGDTSCRNPCFGGMLLSTLGDGTDE